MSYVTIRERLHASSMDVAIVELAIKQFC